MLTDGGYSATEVRLTELEGSPGGLLEGRGGRGRGLAGGRGRGRGEDGARRDAGRGRGVEAGGGVEVSGAGPAAVHHALLHRLEVVLVACRGKMLIGEVDS